MLDFFKADLHCETQSWSWRWNYFGIVNILLNQQKLAEILELWHMGWLSNEENCEGFPFKQKSLFVFILHEVTPQKMTHTFFFVFTTLQHKILKF